MMQFPTLLVVFLFFLKAPFAVAGKCESLLASFAPSKGAAARIELFATDTGNYPFEKWLKKLKDKRAEREIVKRLGRLQYGDLGDHKTLSTTQTRPGAPYAGLSIIELRISYRGLRILIGKTRDGYVVLNGTDHDGLEKEVALSYERLDMHLKKSSSLNVEADDATIRAVVKQEYDSNHAADSLRLALETLQASFSAEARARAVEILKRNPYLESVVMLSLLEDYVAGLDPRHETEALAEAKLLQIIEKRRQLYYSRRKASEPAAITPFDLDAGYTVTQGRTIRIYNALSPILSTRLMEVVPQIDAMWRRKFNPEDRAFPEAIVFSIEDIPGAFIVIFNDILVMNHAFDRASNYIEVASRLIMGNEVFGLSAGGHDLKGADLNRYWKVAQSRSEESRAALPNDAEYLRRLEIESEFFHLVVLPKINQYGEDKVVFISAPSDNNSKKTISHEIQHARYFTNPNYKNAVAHFWSELMTAEEREQFKTVVNLSGLGYDLQNDDLIQNEFQAHMLEILPPVLGTRESDKKLKEYRDLMQSKFLSYLHALGLKVDDLK